MDDGSNENGFDRLDRNLGRLWSRVCGTALLVIAAGFTISAFSSGDILSHWPEIAAAAILLLLAKACFRSRETLLETLSETHRAPAKTNDDQR